MSKVSASKPYDEPFSWRAWGFTAFLLAIFALGGGSRGDIQSLIILRPIAIVVGFFAFFTLSLEKIRHYKWLLILSATPILIAAIQLIPLPPNLWAALPGRAIISEIDKAAGLKNIWRPFSMSPVTTWNALFAFFVPFAAAVFLMHLNKAEKRLILAALIGIGMLSGIIGIFQLAGSSDGPLYFYEVTNKGAAVGLFSNRNHQAIFLASLFSMIAIQLRIAWPSEKGKNVLYTNTALLLSIVLFPLILVTGSRAGVIFTLVSGLAALFLTGAFSGRRRQWVKDLSGRKKIVYGAIISVLSALVLFVIFRVIFARSTAIDRMIDLSWQGEARAGQWPAVLAAAKAYFPAGSGIGSFEAVYKISEPDSLLGPNYLNHAHNDWLEIVMTWGLIGVVFFASWVALAMAYSWRLWLTRKNSRAVLLGRLSSVLLLILALASLVDYPLRVPSIACLAMICAVWLKDGWEDATGIAEK